MLKLIDLFCGCGGMTLGFTNKQLNNKFKPIFAVDFDKSSTKSYNINFGEHAICENIESVSQNFDIPKADIVIGGPPCQGYSLLNKNRFGDSRRSLWKPFLEIVKKSEAKFFVIENVKELYKSDEFNDICNYSDGINFNIVANVLNAANYGVAQKRFRTFIIGFKKNINNKFIFPQEITNSEHGLIAPKWKTVRDVISDLPNPINTDLNNLPPPLNLHFGRNPTNISQKRYIFIPNGGNRFDLAQNAPELTPKCWLNKKNGSTDLFGRLWWDRPSVTIRTEFFKPEKGRYLHPEQNRPITHREAARIMSFPDDFTFYGSKIEIAKQIGNAVPPLLAYFVAQYIIKSLT